MENNSGINKILKAEAAAVPDTKSYDESNGICIDLILRKSSIFLHIKPG